MGKEETYKLLVKQVASLIGGEHELVSILANVAAALREAFAQRYWWVGFYLVKGGRLVLGPFQGPVACYSIGLGRGVCGTAWEQRKTMIVPDVEQFPGHIACSAASRSEIVVPVLSQGGAVLCVLDIDSRQLAAFDATDAQYLQKICDVVAQQLQKR